MEKQINEFAETYDIPQDFDIEDIKDLLQSWEDSRLATVWISVKERLPEEKINVLIYNGYYTTIARYMDKSWSDKFNYHKDVTHWMPLPEPPK